MHGNSDVTVTRHVSTIQNKMRVYKQMVVVIGSFNFNGIVHIGNFSEICVYYSNVCMFYIALQMGEFLY